MTKPTSSAARRAAAMALAMVASCWLCGCGSTIEGLCEDMCDCQGCTDAQLEDCIEEGEDYEQRMEDAGCGDEFEDYVDCVDDSFECIDGEFEVDGSCASELMSCQGPDYG